MRELFIMNELAPNAGFNDSMEELPLSVKPERKVSVEDIARLLGSYYEGTPLALADRLKVKNSKKKADDPSTAELPDSIVSPRANPWMRPDEIAVYEAMGDTLMHNIRTVSVSWCAYSTIIQCRDWLPDGVGGVAWICLDNPGQSPRFPIFAGQTDVPELLKICGQHRERDDAALWRYRKPNRLATVRWGRSREITEPARDHFIKKGAQEMPMVESIYSQYLKDGDEAAAAAFLTDYSKDFFGATINRWDELGTQLWKQNANGF